MSSLPESSLLAMPSLERASSDSSPTSSGMPNDQTAQLAQAFYQNAFNTMYPFGYLPTPSTPSMPMSMMTPMFGYGQPVQMPGYSPHLQSLSYSPFPLPTIPPRYSAGGHPPPVGMPGARPTGCVSPLDLFGSLPTHQSFPATGAILSTGFNAQQPTVDTPVELDTFEAEASLSPEDDEAGLASPDSSTESLESETEKMPVKKAKKSRPNVVEPKVKGEKVESVILVDGQEVKEVKKRSRTAQACEKCRIRKARCFGGNPCNRCIKRKFVCEFTPTRPRPVVKPEPVKPKARRHSMHTVPSAVPVAHPLALVQTHSHQMPNFVVPQVPAFTHTRHMSMIGQGPTLIPGLDEPPSSRLGLGLGLGLSLGLELDTVIDEDSVEGDSDLDMPGMTNSISDSSGSGASSALGTGAFNSMSAAAWASSLGIAQPETVYSPLVMDADDIFQFSPVAPPSSLPLDWGVSDSNSTVPLSSSFIPSGIPHGLGLNDPMHGNDWFGAFRS